MTITKWDPFGDLLDLNRQVVKLFGQDSPREFGRWVPAVDMFEKDSKLVLKVELAGVSPEDVDITADNELLTIKGGKKFHEEVEKEDFYKVEQRYGSFQRSFSLPVDALSDGIDAKFDQDVLQITVPRKIKLEPNKIRIQPIVK